MKPAEPAIDRFLWMIGNFKRESDFGQIPFLTFLLFYFVSSIMMSLLRWMNFVIASTDNGWLLKTAKS